MCGIVGIFGTNTPSDELRKRIVAMAKKIRHRGPDWSGVKMIHQGAIAHERLAINDPESGEQPLCHLITSSSSADASPQELTLAVNGEIYNHLALRAQLTVEYTFKTKSDCECILPLYLEYGGKLGGMVDALNKLKGMFGFVLHDGRDNSFLAVRDYMGIIPLYIGWGADGSVHVASELKAIAEHCVRFQCFPPGHMYSSKDNTFVQWYNPAWHDEEFIPSAENHLALEDLRRAFTDSVRRRMMSDVPWGVLLSGGLDSSLVASVACRLLKEGQVSAPGSGSVGNFGGRLHSFCIGLVGSPDLEAARKVADYLGTIHHSYTFTIQEGLDAVSDVIYSLETFDTTTIRAATPMYLMSRKIKALGVKMVLSGEGADEIFGGYLYFHKAPSAKDLHQETVRKLKGLHLFDCLRANKSTSAWGVEARVPFLDRDFLDTAMAMDPTQKMCVDPKTGAPRMEKWSVRKAFDTPENPYLPHEVLWRQKEQFSDGVGYSWIDSLREMAEREVTDRMFQQAQFLFPENTPPTKENYLYRSIFVKHFPQHSASLTVPGGPSIACSTATAVQWSKEFEQLVAQSAGDCSGRAVNVHNAAYDDAVSVATGAQTKAKLETATNGKRKAELDGNGVEGGKRIKA